MTPRLQRPQARIALTLLVLIAGIAALVVGIILAIDLIKVIAKLFGLVFGDIHPAG